MDILEDVVELFEDNVGTGIAVVGAATLGPTVIPALAKVVKPIAKSTIKFGIILYERGKEAFAEVKEIGEDVYAEAKTDAMETLTKSRETAIKATETAKAAKTAVKTPKGGSA